MKRLTFISLLLSVLLAAGCGSPRAALSHRTAARDSIHESVRITTRTETVPVTVRLHIPEIRETRRRVRDSVDVIENDRAVSTVTLHPDGSFDHSVVNRAREDEVTAEVPVRMTDTCRETFRSSEDREVVTETVEVNVLRWWQKPLMWCGAVAMAFFFLRTALKLLLPQAGGVLTAIKNILNKL